MAVVQSCNVFFVFMHTGLAKRVGARLLLASTSEVYGGKKLMSFEITLSSAFLCLRIHQVALNSEANICINLVVAVAQTLHFYLICLNVD